MIVPCNNILKRDEKKIPRLFFNTLICNMYMYLVWEVCLCKSKSKRSQNLRNNMDCTFM